jgi:hypothetical protein
MTGLRPSCHTSRHADVTAEPFAGSPCAGDQPAYGRPLYQAADSTDVLDATYFYLTRAYIALELGDPVYGQYFARLKVHRRV